MAELRVQGQDIGSGEVQDKARSAHVTACAQISHTSSAPRARALRHTDIEVPDGAPMHLVATDTAVSVATQFIGTPLETSLSVQQVSLGACACSEAACNDNRASYVLYYTRKHMIHYRKGLIVQHAAGAKRSSWDMGVACYQGRRRTSRSEVGVRS
jgi:hypothetical protein